MLAELVGFELLFLDLVLDFCNLVLLELLRLFAMLFLTEVFVSNLLCRVGSHDELDELDLLVSAAAAVGDDDADVGTASISPETSVR